MMGRRGICGADCVYFQEDHCQTRSKLAIECGAVKRAKLNLHETTLQVCEKHYLARRWEKDTVARKSLSLALCKARQVMRRKQTDLRFKIAMELGAPSRLKSAPPPERVQILERSNADG